MKKISIMKYNCKATWPSGLRRLSHEQVILGSIPRVYYFDVTSYSMVKYVKQHHINPMKIQNHGYEGVVL